MLNVTVSIGVWDFAVGANNEEVIKSTNKAMLQAKIDGKNQYKLMD